MFYYNSWTLRVAKFVLILQSMFPVITSSGSEIDLRFNSFFCQLSVEKFIQTKSITSVDEETLSNGQITKKKIVFITKKVKRCRSTDYDSGRITVLEGVIV